MHPNNSITEETDVELGIDSKFKNVVRMIFEPPLPTRKDEEIFGNEFCTNSTSTLVANDSFVIDNIELPQKRYGRIHRNLRYTWLTLYRRLWLFVLAANSLAMIVVGLKGKQCPTLSEVIQTASAVNLTVAIVIRQDTVVNLLFIIFGSCPIWLPLRLRRIFADVYHLGGIHSGAGAAATAWYGFYNYNLIKSSDKSQPRRLTFVLWAVTIAIDICLCGMIGFSHPGFRSKFHNSWEYIHRFVGWSTLGLLWTHYVLSMVGLRIDPTSSHTFGYLLITRPVFWCLLIATISIALPWFRLRKVSVELKYSSGRAARLHFDHISVPRCTASRFSDNPLKEWHAFAGIPAVDGAGFSILVSVAGDWTSRIVAKPPEKLWIKGDPVRGVLYMASIFRRLVLVATGSGIAPILSLTVGRSLDVRIIWSTSDPVAAFGKDIVEHVKRADPNAVIINTTEAGRPDLVREAYRLYVSSKAEAVFVITNPSVTRNIVYGLESRGVPVFAPIFDS